MKISLQKKIEQSINLIQLLDKPEYIYTVGFSGGKDSIVLLDLVKKSNVKYKAIYNNTTVDFPEIKSFIKKNYPEVEIKNPKLNMIKLIEQKGIPLRRHRFCCANLKENSEVNQRIVLGIRKQESFKRSLYEPEQCNKKRNSVRISPILEWTDEDIWEYIKANKLPYLKYYNPPFSFRRIGCVGCPMTTQKTRIKEFTFFNKYVYLYVKAFEKRRNKSKSELLKQFSSGWEIFHWWISEQSMKQFLYEKNHGFFEMNSEQIIKNIFKLKK